MQAKTAHDPNSSGEQLAEILSPGMARDDATESIRHSNECTVHPPEGIGHAAESIGHAAEGIAVFDDAGFGKFTAQAKRLGFAECLVRSWEADRFIDVHTHDFAVQALVVEGELWLGVDGALQHLRKGARFSLESGVPHTERYGAHGAVFWVARSSVRPA